MNKVKKIRIITASVVASMLVSSLSTFGAMVDKVYISDLDEYLLTIEGSELDAGKDYLLYLKYGKNVSGTMDTAKEYLQQITTDAEGSYTYTFKFEPSLSGVVDAENRKYSVYTQGGATDFGEFDYFTYADIETLIDEIDDKATTEGIYEAIVPYAQIMGLDLTFADLNSNASADIEKIVKERIAEIKEKGPGKLKSTIDIIKARYDFLAELAAKEFAPEVNTLVNEYKLKAEIDLSAYDELSNSQRQYVCSSLAKTSYQSFDSFIVDMAKYIAESKNNGGSTGGSGSSGGSGGSGSSGGSGGGSWGVKAPAAEEKPQQVLNNTLFNDVDKNHWAYEAIEYLHKNKIISGYANGNFEPDKTITRAELVKIIVSTCGIDTSDLSCSFDDVPSTHWAYPFVSAAFAKGITTGIDEATFGVDQNASRQDIACFVYRAFNLEGVDDSSDKFTDESQISDYAFKAVNTLKTMGIINGYEDGSFRPNAFATRAEIAKIVYAMVKGDK